MLYADYQFYTELYGADMDGAAFNRHAWHACKAINGMVTGVDGYNKLKNAYPTDEDAVEAVKRCMCALVNFAYEVEQAKNVFGYTTDANGNMTSRMVTSKSSGSESISYASGNGTARTSAALAATDDNARRQMQCNIINEYLSDITDANGVNLLYLGRYPRCTETQ